MPGSTYSYVVPCKTCELVAPAATVNLFLTNMNFTVNNSEFAKDALVSEEVSGQPFGWNNTAYVMNDTVTTGNVRNRPVITFTNTGTNSATIDVAVFIA